jgi:hypothetical protein
LIPLALILITAALAVWVLLPLGRAPDGDPLARPDDLGELEARHQSLLFELQDVDFDLQTGKLSREDHAALRARLQTEAVEVIRRLDEARPCAADQGGRRETTS